VSGIECRRQLLHLVPNRHRCLNCSTKFLLQYGILTIEEMGGIIVVGSIVIAIDIVVVIVVIVVVGVVIVIVVAIVIFVVVIVSIGIIVVVVVVIVVVTVIGVIVIVIVKAEFVLSRYKKGFVLLVLSTISNLEMTWF